MADFYLPLVDMDTGREARVDLRSDEVEVLEELHAQLRLIEGLQVDSRGKFRSGLTIDMLDWGQDYNPRDVMGSIYIMGRNQSRTHWKITVGRNGHVLGLFLYVPLSFFPDVVSSLPQLQALKLSLNHVPIETWPEFPDSLKAFQLFNPKGQGVFPQESLRNVRKIHLIMPFDRIIFERDLEWKVGLFFMSVIDIWDLPRSMEILSLNSCMIFASRELSAPNLRTLSIHNSTIHNEFLLRSMAEIEVSGRVNFDILESSLRTHRFVFNYDTRIA